MPRLRSAVAFGPPHRALLPPLPITSLIYQGDAAQASKHPCNDRVLNASPLHRAFIISDSAPRIHQLQTRFRAFNARILREPSFRDRETKFCESRGIIIIIVVIVFFVFEEYEREMFFEQGNSHISSLIREESGKGRSILPEAIDPEISRADFHLNISNRGMASKTERT